jgi:hypothetical protein
LGISDAADAAAPLLSASCAIAGPPDQLNIKHEQFKITIPFFITFNFVFLISGWSLGSLDSIGWHL